MKNERPEVARAHSGKELMRQSRGLPIAIAMGRQFRSKGAKASEKLARVWGRSHSNQPAGWFAAYCVCGTRQSPSPITLPNDYVVKTNITTDRMFKTDTCISDPHYI